MRIFSTDQWKKVTLDDGKDMFVPKIFNIKSEDIELEGYVKAKYKARGYFNTDSEFRAHLINLGCKVINGEDING